MVSETVNILDAAREHVQELMKKNDPSHDWFHVERVYKNAVHLAEQEQLADPTLSVDMEVVQLAALFHDAVDFKYDHAAGRSLESIAEERLPPFFARFGLPDAKVAKIVHIVLNISWRKELENKQQSEPASDCEAELSIVRDADRLDAIGAMGVARCFAFSGAKMRPLHVPNARPIENMSAQQYNEQSVKNESTAVNHFYEKLLLVKDKMKTRTGRVLAEQRNEFMLQYLKQFDAEVALLS
jgi:uncharacterized protein